MLGDDVPDRFPCFMRRTGHSCFGRTGATTIRIEDYDGKVCNKYFSGSLIFQSVQKTSCLVGSELYENLDVQGCSQHEAEEAITSSDLELQKC